VCPSEAARSAKVAMTARAAKMAMTAKASIAAKECPNQERGGGFWVHL